MLGGCFASSSSKFECYCNVAVENEPVCPPVTQPIQGGRPQRFVSEGISPFTKIQIAGDYGGGVLIALIDEIVEVFVMRCTTGYGTKLP